LKADNASDFLLILPIRVVFHTCWFLELLWSQTLVIDPHPKNLFTHRRTSWQLALFTTLGIATGEKESAQRRGRKFAFVLLFGIFTKTFSYISS
jgi:hypothetical protein